MSDESLPPIAPAAHVVELSYATPRDDLRPGYLTATAIVSIIVGSLSALGSGSTFIRYLTQYQFYLSRPTGSPVRFIVDAAMHLLSFIAAGILIFGGIRLLQNRRTAARLHWVFVGIKLPLILFEFLSAMLALMSARAMNPFVLTIVLTSVVFSMIYPATLCVILTRPRAKAYFARRV